MARIPAPRRFQPRNIPCPRNCGRFFSNVTGVKSHMHYHYRQDRFTRQCAITRSPPSHRSPSPFLPQTNGFDEESDEENWGEEDPYPPGPSSRAASPDQHHANQRPVNEVENVEFHSKINGRPCNRNGDFIPDDTPPEPWEDPALDDYSPFQSREHFELSELLYKRTQMPQSHISDLMQIWAKTLQDPDSEPPFANYEHLYETIDAIEHGDVSWESFTTSYNGEITEENDAPWRHASYEIWYRDPLKVLKNQLSNRDFAKEMDFAPKKVYDSKTGKRRYQDFMSGEWAWWQADIIAQDEENHGATFCPIVLGSDKTTVSVATGQNEYYPVYLSNGLIHNNVRRAHRNGVTLIAFLAIPKTDQEHQCCDNFRRFRRALYHSSLRQILSTLRPGMTKSQLIRFVDGHYRRVITGLGPYIGDYPEQVQLACVVQGWCARCTATRKDLDGPRGRRTHELTATLRRACTTRKLWKGYGIIDGIMPFTYDFPRANIHELLSPDLLHQLVKGVFKDHLVTWVEAYIRRNHPPVQATRILAEIDRRIAAAPLFPDLRRFKEGRGFKQWTGKDSKAFMKVYLAAIAGLVLPRIVRAVRYFLEFCYHVRRDVIDDDDLEKLDELLVKYHEEREVFREEDVRPTGFNLPRQHSLTHYRELIIDFGAPNGLCSSITESKHIDAVKDPYRRSNRNDPLSQILLINQRMDKLSAARIDFTARGMLQDSLFQEHTAVPPDVAEKIQKIRDEDDDGGSWDGENIFGEALMAKTSVQSYPRRFEILINYLGIPSLREDVSRFLYELDHPNMEIPLRDVPIAECPAYTGNIFIFPSAIAIYRAPSDLSGLSGMYHERIRSTASWRSGPERRDCVYIVQDQDLPGFRGLYVAQVRLFFKIRYKRIVHACAWVSWFKTVGDEPCSDTGMWRVEPEYDKHGDRLTSVILLDTILRASHLIGIAGEGFIPHDLKYTDSLTAFNAFYVNKYIDYHAHETVF